MTETTSATFVASNGAPLAVHDLGGTGRPLLVAHATGFHGRAYAPFAASLSDRFHVLAYDARGHGESGVPVPGCPGDVAGTGYSPADFAADVLAVVDALDLESAAAFGHSAGATSLLLAEEARPGTFSFLYCFEPIIAATDDLPPPNPDNRLSVGARARRETFSSLQAAYDNYASKPPLDVLSAAALWAYVEHGFAPQPDGTVRLRCRGDDEASMYAQGLTHDAYRRLSKVTCPVVLACGETTDAVGHDVLDLLAQRLPRVSQEVLRGLGHFGPLEDPDAVAASVVRAMEQWPEPPG